ncbi:MAG: hypothetical protein HJHJAOHD_02551 [Flavobacteriales bacterium]|nr:hypothetical protein [Flavobacteriales bacterium]
MKNSKQISNPYREVGRLHNEGLDYVIKNLNPKEQVTIEKIIELTGQYLLTIKNNTSKADLALYYEFVATTINGLNQIPFQEFLREAKISKEGICFINDIQNISPDFDLPTTLKVLTNIEANILTSEMTEQEKQFPLICVGVAISSVGYWIKQINDQKSLWIPFVGEPSAFRWPWKKDAEGAIAGGIGGAVGGAVGGLGGVLIGGLLGAIGGAIGASVASAILD